MIAMILCPPLCNNPIAPLHFTKVLPKLASALVAIALLSPAAIAAERQFSQTASPAPNPPSISQAQTAAAITEEQIRQALTQVQQSANQGSIDGMLRFLAPNAFIEMTVQLPNGTAQTLRFNRDEYAANLRQNFQQLKTYQTAFRNLKTRIAADGKSAIATFNTFEEGTIERQKIRTASSQIVILELQFGKVKATSIRSSVRMVVEPLQ